MLVVALSTLLAGILALGAATLAGTAHASRATEPSYPKPTIVPYPGAPAGDGDAYIDPARFHRLFAQDLPRSTTDLMGATQRPGALGALVTPQAPRRGRPSPAGTWSPSRTASSRRRPSGSWRPARTPRQSASTARTSR